MGVDMGDHPRWKIQILYTSMARYVLIYDQRNAWYSIDDVLVCKRQQMLAKGLLLQYKISSILHTEMLFYACRQ